MQFSSETNSAANTFSGRVEHLNSAHRTRFESLEELAAVLTRMLGELGER